MSQGPEDQWRRLQIILQNRANGARFNFGGGGGGPRNWGVVGSLVLLGVGGYALSNSLFNGTAVSGWFGFPLPNANAVL